MTTTPQAALLSDELHALIRSFGYTTNSQTHDLVTAILAKLQATQEPVQTTGPWDHDFIAGRLPRPSHHTTQPATGADVLDGKRWRYAIADGGNQSMNFLDIYDDWDGDGAFVDAFDKAMNSDAAIAASGRQE